MNSLVSALYQPLVLAGFILIIMGIAMITGYLSRFSIWLTENFPWLSKLG